MREKEILGNPTLRLLWNFLVWECIEISSEPVEIKVHGMYSIYSVPIGKSMKIVETFNS